MSEILQKFSKKIPDWLPRVRPVELSAATAEQLDALKVTPSNTKISAYTLVLAHDVETLKVRSPLFNAIMYEKGGLSRPERELGAIGSSIVNRCIYCAAVHAQRHAQLTKSEHTTDALFSAGENAQLEPREQAIFNFALALSATPAQAGDKHISALREAGLDDQDILDLILSTSLFAWANRLMHILGDPVKKTVIE